MKNNAELVDVCSLYTELEKCHKILGVLEMFEYGFREEVLILAVILNHNLWLLMKLYKKYK